MESCLTLLSRLDASNPFASRSTLPYALPDFAAIRDEHYIPAVRAGMAAEPRRDRGDRHRPEPADRREHPRGPRAERRGPRPRAHGPLQRGEPDSSPALEDIEETLAPEPLRAPRHDLHGCSPVLPRRRARRGGPRGRGRGRRRHAVAPREPAPGLPPLRHRPLARGPGDAARPQRPHDVPRGCLRPPPPRGGQRGERLRRRRRRSRRARRRRDRRRRAGCDRPRRRGSLPARDAAADPADRARLARPPRRPPPRARGLGHPWRDR